MPTPTLQGSPAHDYMGVVSRRRPAQTVDADQWERIAGVVDLLATPATWLERLASKYRG